MTIFIAISNLFPLSGLFSGEQRISLPLQWGGSESSEGSADGHWHASAVPLSMTSESIASNNSKKHQKSSFFETWTYRIISRPFQVSEILQFIVTTRLLKKCIYSSWDLHKPCGLWVEATDLSADGSTTCHSRFEGKGGAGRLAWWVGSGLVEWTSIGGMKHGWNWGKFLERNTWGFWNAK